MSDPTSLTSIKPCFCSKVLPKLQKKKLSSIQKTDFLKQRNGRDEQKAGPVMSKAVLDTWHSPLPKFPCRTDSTQKRLRTPPTPSYLPCRFLPKLKKRS